MIVGYFDQYELRKIPLRVIAFSVVHTSSHAALRHFETPNTGDMKLKVQEIWSIFQNAFVMETLYKIAPLVSFCKIVSIESCLIQLLL